jgi:hypothetical protein
MVKYFPSLSVTSCLDKKIAHETSICCPLMNSLVSCVFLVPDRRLVPDRGLIAHECTWVCLDRIDLIIWKAWWKVFRTFINTGLGGVGGYSWEKDIIWRQAAVPSAAMRRGATSVSRCANRVCTPNIATPSARGIIGRCIKKNVNYEPPSYAMRRCSRIRRQRRTVPSASYQCL